MTFVRTIVVTGVVAASLSVAPSAWACVPPPRYASVAIASADVDATDRSDPLVTAPVDLVSASHRAP